MYKIFIDYIKYFYGDETMKIADNNKFWEEFVTSGKISDYLKYKSGDNVVLQGEEKNEPINTGFSSKRDGSLSNGSWGS